MMISNVNYDKVLAPSAASPRSSPSASIYSRPSDEFLPESGLEPHMPFSGHDELTRGGNETIFDAKHRRDSPSTWNWPASSSVDFSSDPWRERLTSRDWTAEPEEDSYSLLEPCPQNIIRTMTEILHPASTFSTFVDVSGFGGHRDTFAILGLRRIKGSTDLPFYFFQRLVACIDFETYLSVRLCCRAWSRAVTHARPLKLPAVAIVPAELLMQIYTYLSPADFNAARHTCRSWMVASLEWQLLTRMLERGCWWAAAEADMAVDEALGMDRLTLSDEWLLSKRLATECSLRPDWTGDGLGHSLAVSFIQSYDNRPLPTTERSNPTSITLTSEVDFSELSRVYSVKDLRQYSAVLGFTVSIYNKFLLIHGDCTIYVYTLKHKALSTIAHNGIFLEFTTSITCPYPVLAVSMDSSYERFAVAALLEGRMGLVYNLYDDVAVRRYPSVPWRPSDFKSGSCENKPKGNFSCPCSHRAISEQDLSRTNGVSIDVASHERSDLTRTTRVTPGPLPNLDSSGIPRRLLSNICSPSSPPLSIAICPQRRCVAFGSATGIEIHWADALSNQMHTRWFPITTKSEILHFMPVRLGDDPEKEVRLITSAINPCGREEVAHRRFLSRTKIEGRRNPNFVQAVPLSDGIHVLFTRPGSGKLSLGHEAASSALGDTKLMTRAVLLGPKDKQGGIIVPKVYKAATELRWGVRIVVVYADAVWLFCVPPDLFFSSETECEQCGEEDEDKENRWPLQIQGIEIGTMRELSEVAIDADGGGITVWTFSAEGKAYMYQLGDGRTGEIRKIFALGTGEVVDEKDAEGDVCMRGTEDSVTPGISDSHGSPSSGSFGFPSMTQQTLLCAAADITKPTYFDEHVAVSHFTAAGPLPLLPIQDDRDTVMPDAPALEDEGYFSGGERSDTSMPDAPPYNDDKDEDEGYVSAEEEQDEEMRQAGGVFAIHTPRRWSDEQGDWLPDHLGGRGDIGGLEGDGGADAGGREKGEDVDVLGQVGLEVQILGG